MHVGQHIVLNTLGLGVIQPLERIEWVRIPIFNFTLLQKLLIRFSDSILFVCILVECSYELTSFLLPSGKTSLMNKMTKSERMQTLSAKFLKDEATSEEIGAAGNEIFLNRYVLRNIEWSLFFHNGISSVVKSWFNVM